MLTQQMSSTTIAVDGQLSRLGSAVRLDDVSLNTLKSLKSLVGDFRQGTSTVRRIQTGSTGARELGPVVQIYRCKFDSLADQCREMYTKHPHCPGLTLLQTQFNELQRLLGEGFNDSSSGYSERVRVLEKLNYENGTLRGVVDVILKQQECWKNRMDGQRILQPLVPQQSMFRAQDLPRLSDHASSTFVALHRQRLSQLQVSQTQHSQLGATTASDQLQGKFGLPAQKSQTASSIPFTTAVTKAQQVGSSSSAVEALTAQLQALKLPNLTNMSDDKGIHHTPSKQPVGAFQLALGSSPRFQPSTMYTGISGAVATLSTTVTTPTSTMKVQTQHQMKPPPIHTSSGACAVGQPQPVVATKHQTSAAGLGVTATTTTQARNHGGLCGDSLVKSHAGFGALLGQECPTISHTTVSGNGLTHGQAQSVTLPGGGLFSTSPFSFSTPSATSNARQHTGFGGSCSSLANRPGGLGTNLSAFGPLTVSQSNSTMPVSTPLELGNGGQIVLGDFETEQPSDLVANSSPSQRQQNIMYIPRQPRGMPLLGGESSADEQIVPGAENTEDLGFSRKLNRKCLCESDLCDIAYCTNAF